MLRRNDSKEEDKRLLLPKMGRVPGLRIATVGGTKLGKFACQVTGMQYTREDV